MFVGFGLLSLILGCLLSPFLLIPAAVLSAFGTLLLAVRRRLWIALTIASVVLAAALALGFSVLIGRRFATYQDNIAEELSAYTDPTLHSGS